MTLEFIHRIGQNSVVVVEFDIPHLRCEIDSFRLHIELQRYLGIIDRDQILDDLRAFPALDGSCIQKMIDIAMLRFLPHQRHNALRRKIGRERFVLAEQQVQHMRDGLTGDERAHFRIFGENIVSDVSAVPSERDRRICL